MFLQSQNLAAKRLQRVNHVLVGKKDISVNSMQQRMRMKKIGVVGFGAMNGALIEGFLNSKITHKQNLCAIQITKDRQKAAEQIGIKTYSQFTQQSIKSLVQFSDIILVGVKPQDFNKVIQQISAFVTTKHLIISIAAGITISDMLKYLAPDTRIVRVMPNTPCMIGCGATGFSLSKTATEEDSKIVKIMFESVGVAFQVAENKLDAVTGISGSSPAYIYMIIEAMADGGVYSGLPRHIALSLASKAVEGAAKMVLGSKQLTHPGVLKDKVTSPSGTTIEAVKILQQKGVRSALMNAVIAASTKSKLLGNPASTK